MKSRTKKILIASETVIALFLIACFPIPGASYDDGGTREYKALTYKMVKWNRLYEGDLRYNSTRFYFGKNKNKSIDELWAEIRPDVTTTKQAENNREPEGGTVTFSATVSEVNGGGITVEPAPGSNERNSADKILIPANADNFTDKTKAFPTLEAGDEITVSYDGMIAETYPAQIMTVFDVVKVHYVRSYCAPTKTAFPYAVVLKSRAELKNYYDENKTLWNFEENPNGNNDASFQQVIKKYDDAYFTNNALICAVTQEGSGSYFYRNARITGNTIQIERVKPEVFTCDMAYWHVIFEVDKIHPALSEKLSVQVEDITAQNP